MNVLHQTNVLYEIALFFTTSLTLLIQSYVIFLVLFKSPPKMVPFRFALCLFLCSDFAFTFSIGFVMDPDLVMPYARGAFVNGLAKFVGPNAGRISFAVAIFFGASMIESQVYSVMFRYTAIQQRWVFLHNQFNAWRVRIAFLLLGLSIAGGCAFGAFGIIAGPEEIIPVLRSRHHFDQMMAIMNNTDAPLLLFNMDGLRAFGPNSTAIGKILPAIIVGGFTLAQLLSLIFSLLIFRVLRENVASFSARTYQLHRQLTMLLIIQFCLPLLFVIFPVSYTIGAIIFEGEISQTAGELGMLCMSLYTFCNSMLTLLFITPYREYTFTLLRVRKLRNILFKNGNQVETIQSASQERNS